MRSPLVGAWELVACADVDDDGTLREGPLGPTPKGMLIYDPDGHVSVTMMRPGGTNPDGTTTFMGYAGRWHTHGDRVVHEITVSLHAHMVGRSHVREVTLNGTRLELCGSVVIAGVRHSRRLTWRRITPLREAS